MKILLIGEYSNLHNSLKQSLLKKGHDVILIADGDGFKEYDVDILIKSIIFENKILKVLTKIIDKLTGISLNELEIYLRAKREIRKLESFDVVQLINERPFKTSPTYEKKLLEKIFRKNKNIYLLACGVDHTTVKYAFEKKFKYSILTPYFNNKKLKIKYKQILKYLNSDYKDLSSFIKNNINGIISSDLDYHIPYIGENKYLGMIPNPINIDFLKYNFNHSKKIKILHPINSVNKIKKGNIFFTESLKFIEEKYSHKIKITITTNEPYKKHINNVIENDIILDQVYAYDQGYNALESMALGKVVFTGAEEEWLKKYNIKPDSVVINALPDVTKIVQKLSWLIENPNMIKMISKNARKFILKYHNYEQIGTKYLQTWKK